MSGGRGSDNLFIFVGFYVCYTTVRKFEYDIFNFRICSREGSTLFSPCDSLFFPLNCIYFVRSKYLILLKNTSSARPHGGSSRHPLSCSTPRGFGAKRYDDAGRVASTRSKTLCPLHLHVHHCGARPLLQPYFFFYRRERGEIFPRGPYRSADNGHP